MTDLGTSKNNSDIVSDLDFGSVLGASNISGSELDNDTDYNKFHELENNSEDEELMIQNIRKKNFENKNVIVSSDEGASDNDAENPKSLSVTLCSNQSINLDLNVLHSDARLENEISLNTVIDIRGSRSSILNITNPESSSCGMSTNEQNNYEDKNQLPNGEKNNINSSKAVKISPEDEMEYLKNPSDTDGSNSTNLHENELDNDTEYNKSYELDTNSEDEGFLIQNIRKKYFKKKNVIVTSDEEILDNDAEHPNILQSNVRIENVSKKVIDIFGSSSFSKKVTTPANKSIKTSIDSQEILNMSSSEDERKYLTNTPDFDDHDNDIERQMLSPRTRMSITGIRNSDLSDDSDISDVFLISRKKKKRYLHSSGSDDSSSNLPRKPRLDIQTTFNHSIVAIENSKQSILIEDSDSDEIMIYDSDEENTKSAGKNDFLCSTKFSKKFEDPDILFVESKTKQSLSISDLNDNKSHILNNNMLKSSSVLKNSRMNNINSDVVIYVSEEEYEKELSKLQKLESELSDSRLVVDQLKFKLPDNGIRVAGRIKLLRLQITNQMNYISRLEIRNEVTVPQPNFEKPDLEIISWDDLNAGVDGAQPKFTSMADVTNFNMQKGLTTEALQNIHGSLETCPNENVLATDPKGLKIPLMNHQKYALSWMEWREKQRPRGGILADDMGLGKTLTCIAYILSTFSQEENHEPDSDEGSYSGWTTNRRKDYYNGGTLVVCPASLLGQWENEIKNRIDRNLIKYELYHGSNRDKNAKILGRNDIVITTYSIVSRENLSNGVLFNIKWKRIILDEAHIIRNSKSLLSKGACNLNGTYKWILTGTPIQNKEDDVFALFKFLKCKPFDELVQFKKFIAIKTTGGQCRLNTIMKGLMLRRMKSQLIAKGSIIDLPPKEIKLVFVTLDKEEMNVYQKILMYSKTLFAQYLHQRVERTADQYISGVGTSSTSKSLDVYYKAHQRFARSHGNKEVKSHEILVLILRLRQICCHPGLITAMLEDSDRSKILESSGADESEIDLLNQVNKLKIYPEEEGESSINNSENMQNSGFVLKPSNPVFNYTRPSSKIRKILDIIENEILNKNEKAIIVSQWAKVLEIVGKHLKLRGIKSTTLDGSVAVKLRGDIVSKFNSKTSNAKVMLLSLTAGGVGLNLTGANHLLLIDLHWNPQLESQAQDRIYRVGQYKPVTIHKLLCADTIEYRIKALQEKKLQIANDVLSGAITKGSKLTLDDLKSLFELF